MSWRPWLLPPLPFPPARRPFAGAVAPISIRSIPSTSNLAFLNHIYEGLVRYGPDFQIEPALATEWKLIDGKTWRFTLRKGVKFHDGADFTADDVVASFTRASDATSPLRGNIPIYAGVKKVDDYTVDLDVNAPTSLFLNDITNIFILTPSG